MTEHRRNWAAFEGSSHMQNWAKIATVYFTVRYFHLTVIPDTIDIVGPIKFHGRTNYSSIQYKATFLYWTETGSRWRQLPETPNWRGWSWWTNDSNAAIYLRSQWQLTRTLTYNIARFSDVHGDDKLEGSRNARKIGMHPAQYCRMPHSIRITRRKFVCQSPRWH